MLRHAALFWLIAILSACGSGPIDRYNVIQPEVTQNLPIAFQSVEIREVSLPTYASSEEIHRINADGVLRSSPDVLWADAPERAIALDLSRNLARLTNARVASAPWPLEAFPDARLDIRFEDLIAEETGAFRARGQFFVGVEGRGRERSGLFDLVVSFDPDGGPTAIAAARGQIILDLAAFIARNGLN